MSFHIKFLKNSSLADSFLGNSFQKRKYQASYKNPDSLCMNICFVSTGFPLGRVNVFRGQHFRIGCSRTEVGVNTPPDPGQNTLHLLQPEADYLQPLPINKCENVAHI